MASGFLSRLNKLLYWKRARENQEIEVENIRIVIIQRQKFNFLILFAMTKKERKKTMNILDIYTMNEE